MKKYVIVDIPSSLFFAECFLGSEFENVRRGPPVLNDGITLLNASEIDCLKDDNFDLVVNTCSFQEMAQNHVGDWMAFIQHTINAKSLYSMNYAFCNKKNLAECGGSEANLICPVFDGCWEIQQFDINPFIMMIDSDRRNWLELFAVRKPEDEGCASWFDSATEVTPIQQKLLFLWNAVWKKDVSKDVYAEILDTIKMFATYRIPNLYDRMFDGDYRCFGEYVYFYNKMHQLSV